MKIFELKSVGCGIDENGITYPALREGGYDFEMGIPVDEIYEEAPDWKAALSSYDKGVVEYVLKFKS